MSLDGRGGEVSWIALRPPRARAGYVLAHGAGADMRHAFMESMAGRLAERGIATFRFQVPYTEAGRRRPDHRTTLLRTVRSAVSRAARELRGLLLVAGGKSMGGRMTSLAASEAPLAGVAGLVFLGFPLHAAGRPSRERADHLRDVKLPLLFVQGTRDGLAGREDLQVVCTGLGKRATLHWIESGDHGFHVLKRSGRSDDEALDEVADRVADWTLALV